MCETRRARASCSRSRSFSLSLPCFRLRYVACHAPSFSHAHRFYSLRFPLFLFAFVSLYLRLPSRLLRARSPEIFSLWLGSFADVPLVRCPSLSFSVWLAAFTRNFLLSRSSWITSRRFSFYSRLLVLSRLLLVFFCMSVHLALFFISI